MDNLAQMSTTGRHNRLVGTLFGEILALLKKKELDAFHEECSLLYYGKKSAPNSLRLIDVDKIEDMKEFMEDIVYELDYVQPDFFLFKDNKYITDSKDVRIAGQPDLIVEVWSKNNSKYDRDMLRTLYATSETTEFWQVEQNSNTVHCSLGSKKLPEQSLKNILKTQKGLEFDLRYLAVPN